MRKFDLILSFSLLATSAYAQGMMIQSPSLTESEECCESGSFYLKLGTGATFPYKAKIHASPALWDPSPQGYNGSLGVEPIIEGGLGYEFCPLISTDLVFSYRPNFSYKKFQTSTATSTPGFAGTKTRRFKLDIATMLFSAYLSGRDICYISWDFPCICSSLYPIIGGGVGVSQLKIFDFRSTGLPSVDPLSNPFPSFTAENQYTIRYRFTYQVLAGLEFRYHHSWALSLGYRWFDINRFKGPRYFRDSLGHAFDAENKEWRIKFKTNELFLDLKVFF